jgi:hypothetical protein
MSQENLMTAPALTFIAGLVLAPLAAAAQPGDANSVLRGQIQALQVGGFLGMPEIQMPQAPGTVRAIPVSVQSNETTEALWALILGAQKDVDLNGATVRALGFDFNGDQFPTKGYFTPKDTIVRRYFTVTSLRGKTDIIISEFRKIDDRKEMLSYLISPDGTLEAAAVTRKKDGKFQAERIAVSEAQAGCRELLEFWTQYYRENLKTP